MIPTNSATAAAAIDESTDATPFATHPNTRVRPEWHIHLIVRGRGIPKKTADGISRLQLKANGNGWGIVDRIGITNSMARKAVATNSAVARAIGVICFFDTFCERNPPNPEQINTSVKTAVKLRDGLPDSIIIFLIHAISKNI